MKKKTKSMLWLKQVPWIPVIILGVFIFISIFAGAISPHEPNYVDLEKRLVPPGTEGNLLGTDSLGRDMLSRLFYGGRVSLIVSAFVLLIAGSVGLTIGVVAGYFGGKLDDLLMRVVDIFNSFPPILVAIVFAVSLGPGIRTVIIAISLVYWAKFSRVIRAEVLQLKEQDFVALAKVAGCSPLYIMVRHILPNVLDTFAVVMSLQIGMVIRMEATLSFLGAGVPPPDPSWGQMVGAGRDYIDTAWWLSIVPGTALAAVILSFNLLGDWVRDMLDPQLRAIMFAEKAKPKRQGLAHFLLFNNKAGVE